MPRNGMPPIPTALKIARGNPGKKRLNLDEPKPSIASKCPNPPTWICQYAKLTWRRMAPELYKRGLLTVIDHHALAVYCQSIAEYREAIKNIQKNGALLSLETGYKYPNPYLSIKNKAIGVIRQFAIELGMSPSARVHLKVTEPENPTKTRRQQVEDQIFGGSKRKNA